MGSSQEGIWSKALKFRNENLREVATYEQFKEVLDKEGGFISAHWNGTAQTETQIKEETKATMRSLPF